MKATRTFGFWKALAFLTAVIFFTTSCSQYPPTVETVKVEVGADRVSITALGFISDEGSETVLSCGFCLSQHALPTIADLKKEASRPQNNPSANFQATISGLEKNVTYYVRAFAQNAVGISYGEVVEVTTLAAALAITQDSEVLSNTEALLYATVDDFNSEVEIWFEVWTEGETARKVELQKTGAQSASEVFAHATGLTPGLVYSYAVKVKNNAGTVTGETKSFRLYYERVYDRDGNGYWTVKIDNQIWTVENLKTTSFLNGDPIPNIQPDNEWVAMTSPAYCYYNNDPRLGEVYGALYNNYVGLDSRGLIKGYRTPTIQDYETLVSYYGESAVAQKLKSNTEDWYGGRKGDNSSGFTALPGGWRRHENDSFKSLYYQAVFQTTTPMEGMGSFYSAIIYGSGYVMTIGGSSKYFGYSIRLIKN